MNQQGTSFTSPISAHLQALHRELFPISDGHVATYIPELAKADPNWFGIAVVTTNGGVYEVGDSRQLFTIQSISKPFVYGLALEDHGREAVLSKVGVEPTGDAFNSISLDPGTGRPRNPMINAGAIATTGLISGKTPAICIQRILEMFRRYTGRELGIDGSVYGSESATGHRNRAIGHMLRNFDILSGDPMPVVETYFQQCSILGHCLDLATMAATLANRGINPLTGQQAIRGEYVESVLGVMGTCGMYDYAGEWLYEVGMPAKSGVAGGIVAVLPGQLGIGVFSPPLDSHGNSVRGIRACSALSRAWDLHLYNRPGVGNAAIRHRFTAAEYNSSRVRAVRERAALAEYGGGVVLYQLQGNLLFATAELIVRELTTIATGLSSTAPTPIPDPRPTLGATSSLAALSAAASSPSVHPSTSSSAEPAARLETLILDFQHILSLNESACTLFHALLVQLAEIGVTVLFCALPSNSHLRRVMKAKLGPRTEELFRTFEESDIALQWAEDRLLERVLPSLPDMSIGADNYELLHGFNAEELAIVRKLFERRTWRAGETIFSAGDTARDLYLLARGTVSAYLSTDSGGTKRIAVYTAGMAFGEMAILDRTTRSATIVADTETACDLLSIPKLTAIGFSHPKLKIKLLESLALGLCAKLRKANRETSLLA